MTLTLTITVEVSDDWVAKDILKALDLVLPYMADNVYILSNLENKPYPYAEVSPNVPDCGNPGPDCEEHNGACD